MGCVAHMNFSRESIGLLRLKIKSIGAVGWRLVSMMTENTIGMHVRELTSRGIDLVTERSLEVRGNRVGHARDLVYHIIPQAYQAVAVL